jgi:hypothetical protein
VNSSELLKENFCNFSSLMINIQSAATFFYYILIIKVFIFHSCGKVSSVIFNMALTLWKQVMGTQ